MKRKIFLLIVTTVIFLIVVKISLAETISLKEKVNALYKKGTALASEGNFAEARELFNQLLNDVNKYNYPTRKAIIAIDDYDKKVITSAYAMRLFKGLWYIVDGQDQKGINELLAAVEINPTYAEAFINLGVAYYSLGRVEEAKHYYRKAIEVNPQCADAYNGLGFIYETVFADYQLAITQLEKAIGLNPDFAEAYSNLGIAYDYLGNAEEAIHSYKKAIELNPNFDTVYYNLAFIYGSLGKNEEAIQLLQKAIELNPNSANAYGLLGMIFYSSKQFKESRENLEKARVLFESKKDYRSLREIEERLKQIPN